jgi:hypothetical protein
MEYWVDGLGPGRPDNVGMRVSSDLSLPDLGFNGLMNAQDCGICNEGPSSASGQHAQQPKPHGPTRLRPRSKLSVRDATIVPPVQALTRDLLNFRTVKPNHVSRDPLLETLLVAEVVMAEASAAAAAVAALVAALVDDRSMFPTLVTLHPFWCREGRVEPLFPVDA